MPKKLNIEQKALLLKLGGTSNKAMTHILTSQDEVKSEKKVSQKFDQVNTFRGSKKRSIYWNFILYEDSTLKDYLDILKSFQVSFALSPWHDKDLWTKQDELDDPKHISGTLKKKHRHGIFKFEGLKSWAQVKELTDKLNAPIPIRTISISKAVQYFVHKNDPEKHQYDRKDIVDYCFGVDDYFITTPTMIEKAKYFDEMRLWVKENHILRFNNLIDEAMNNRLDTWGRLFTDSPRWSIERYINGCWQESEAKKYDYLETTKKEKQEHIEKTKHKSDSTIKILQQLDELKGKDTKNISPNKPSSAVAPADENNDELPPFEIW